VSKRVRMTAQQRREQLVGVARSVFAERGFEATSIEEIAERAGVSKPVVYQHFGGKQGVYAVVVDREVRRLTASIARPSTPATRGLWPRTRRTPSSPTSRSTRRGSGS
jgi:AcrR family transcriptional regulator